VTELAEALAGAPVAQCTPIGGGHGARHYWAQLADGRALFIKEAADDEGIAALGAEARGWQWLAEAGAVPVPEIIAWHNRTLALVYLPAGKPDRVAAERFGRDLARLHAAGAESFRAPWPGFIASLPLPNEQADSWPSWYADRRLMPYCRIGRDAGTLGAGDVALIESVASRIGELAGPLSRRPESMAIAGRAICCGRAGASG
jgi:fructosamine-3-kinase